MILAVSGWRDWTDFRFVTSMLRPYLLDFQWQLHVRVGDCPTGVDRIIRAMAAREAFSLTVYLANWSLPNKSGGPIRNGQMLRGVNNSKDPKPGVKADRLLAFPQPGSSWWEARSGTGDCIKQAWNLGVRLDIPDYRSDSEERA